MNFKQIEIFWSSLLESGSKINLMNDSINFFKTTLEQLKKKVTFLKIMSGSTALSLTT